MQDSNNTKYSGVDELENSEYLCKYNKSIVTQAMKYLNKKTNILDFGAGIGTLSMIFRDAYGINPVCIEIDESNISTLSERGFKYYRNLSELGNEQNEFIFSSNVLEHIKNDKAIFNDFYKALISKGVLFLYLPANQILWSQMDVAVGHYRRYSKKDLIEKAEQAGFKVRSIFYADCLGFFATLLMKLTGFNSKNGIGSRSSLIFYDRYIFPISRFLDRAGFKFLLGKNIIIVAKKP